jgi:hypothetical protein
MEEMAHQRKETEKNNKTFDYKSNQAVWKIVIFPLSWLCVFFFVLLFRHYLASFLLLLYFILCIVMYSFQLSSLIFFMSGVQYVTKVFFTTSYFSFYDILWKKSDRFVLILSEWDDCDNFDMLFLGAYAAMMTSKLQWSETVLIGKAWSWH